MVMVAYTSELHPQKTVVPCTEVGLGNGKYGAYPTKSSESPPSTGNQYDHIHPHPKRHCDSPPPESKRFKCELYNYLNTSQINLLRRLRKNVTLIQKII